MILTTERVIEYIDNPMIFAIIIPIIIFLNTFILMEIFSRFRDKIHRSYHKGYNRAKDDKVKYYSTLHSLNEKYNEIMESLKSSEVVLKVSTVEKFIEFENLLKDSQG